ncbi:MAG: hypothetical protein HOD16_08180 [Nitrospina sp.]|nr:hypothetical protein [Nitrospina sp.]
MLLHTPGSDGDSAKKLEPKPENTTCLGKVRPLRRNHLAWGPCRYSLWLVEIFRDLMRDHTPSTGSG